MLRVGIAFFSGTGNTWRMAQQYADAFSWHGHHAELLPMEDLIRANDFSWFVKYDLIGLAYPIHAWGAPRLVDTCWKQLPYYQDKRVFLLLTSAGNVGGAIDNARHRCNHLGYRLVHSAHFYTGSFYLDKVFRQQTDRERLRHIQWCDTEAWEAVSEILEDAERDHWASDGIRLASTVWSKAYRAFCSHVHRWFSVSDDCDQCGLCIASCPTDNIWKEDGRIQFGQRCTLCLRCVGVCPQAAISVRHLTQDAGGALAPGFRGYLRRRIRTRSED